MVAVDERIQSDDDITVPADEHDDPLVHYPDKPLLPWFASRRAK
jgi:hypothetical protein